MNDDSDWIYAGEVAVDAGIIMLGDPCYHLHTELENRHKDFGTDWSDFCDKLYVPDGSIDCDVPGIDHKVKMPISKLERNGFHQIGNASSVVVSSGYGDGCYPVYVRKNFEGRVAEVKVVFDGPEQGEPDDGYEDEETNEYDE